MKHAAILGGCGFVGRHFAKRLLDDGWKVTVVDDLSTGIPPHQWMLTSNYEVNLTRVQSDVRLWFHMQGSPEGFDLILHCAAVVGGREKIEGDPLALAANFAIDADFFRWVSRKPQKHQKVVYFSSSAVYPIELQSRASYIALNEGLVSFASNRAGFPDETYGWAKLAGEYLAHRAAERGVDVVIYRPFSGYGEDQDLAYPFPSIIQRVARGDEPLVVWGSGDQMRDFVHVDDVVDCVMETAWKLSPGDVLNIGSGTPTSFFELAFVGVKAMGKGRTVLPDKTKPSGVFYRVSDTAKMLKLYQPKVSLEEGVKRALKRLTVAAPV